MTPLPAVFRRVVPGLVALALSACGSAPPRIPADRIHDNVHTGGSRVRFNADQTLLVSAGWEGRVVLWSLPAGNGVGGWQAHDDSVNGVAFINGGTQLLTAGYDGRLARWSLDGALLQARQLASPITAMVVSEPRGRVVTGHKDGSVQVSALADFAPVASYPVHQHPIKAVAVRAADGALAASDEVANVLLIGADELLTALPPGPTDTWTLDFSPDGDTLMGAGWFRLHKWSLPGGELETLPTPHHGIIKSVQYSRDGEFLVTISRQTDSAIYFLDPDSGAELRRFQKHALCGGDVRLSSDGDFLASTADDASVRIWDLRKLPDLP